MKIYIGADHRGFEMKSSLVSWLQSQGHEVIDCGNSMYEKTDDFVDFTFSVADHVAAEPESRGIVICGSAGGVTIAANKVKGIRCTTAISTADVFHNRQHDNIQILALSSDFTLIADAQAMITVFLSTPYLGEERHVRRLQKITDRESKGNA